MIEQKPRNRLDVRVAADCVCHCVSGWLTNPMGQTLRLLRCNRAFSESAPVWGKTHERKGGADHSDVGACHSEGTWCCKKTSAGEFCQMNPSSHSCFFLAFVLDKSNGCHEPARRRIWISALFDGCVYISLPSYQEVEFFGFYFNKQTNKPIPGMRANPSTCRM